MNKVVLLSVAFFVPNRAQVRSVASLGSRVMVGDQYIEREVKRWRKVPEKIMLRARKRAHGTLSSL